MLDRVIKAIKNCDKWTPEISEQTRLIEDLGFDSFDTLMLISELEGEFNININEADFAEIVTVGDIVAKLAGAL